MDDRTVINKINSGKALDRIANQFKELSASMNKMSHIIEVESIVRAELLEIKDLLGNWDEVRFMIAELENGDLEDAFVRHEERKVQ